eukprot:4989279-Pyramimonas_sp.AAC.1
MAFNDVSPEREVIKLVDQLRFLAKEDEPGTIATACSGTDVIIVALQTMFDIFAKAYQVHLSVRHVFSCEKDKDAQQFLMNHHPKIEAL